MSKKNVAVRLFGVSLALMIFITLLGCPVAIPIIVHKQIEKHRTATVQLSVKPDKVYNTALQIIDSDPALKLEDKDNEDRELKATKGNMKAEVKVKTTDTGQTLLIVTANGPADNEEDQKLALRIAQRICDRLGVQYEVVEHK